MEINLETQVGNDIDLETRLSTWKQEITWKYNYKLEKITINLETSLLSWKLYFQLRNFIFNFETLFSTWKLYFQL